MPAPTLRASARLFAWGIFKRSYWTLTTLVFDPYDILSRAIDYLAPGLLPSWEVPIMMFWISIALFVLLMAFFTYHELHKVSQAEIDRLTPPPEHPRVTDAKAEYVALAQEGSQLAARADLTYGIYAVWQREVLLTTARITSEDDGRNFMHFAHNTPKPPDERLFASTMAARGASWLMRRADSLRYDELTPAFTHPAQQVDSPKVPRR